MEERIHKQILELKARLIDTSQFIAQNSIYQQIKKQSAKSLKSQISQFNLGNGKKFQDPIKASEYLLQREYGQTFLFDEKLNQPVFIPPVFTSSQSADKAVLDFNVDSSIQETLVNLKRDQPDFWLTKDLEAFIQLHQDSEGRFKKLDEIFHPWILNMKLKYLAIHELKTDEHELHLPLAIEDKATLLKDLFVALPRDSELRLDLSSIVNKNTGRIVENHLKNKQPTDSNLKWFFNLNLGDRGNRIENWFFDQLLDADDELVSDLVILQSVNFFTNLKNKMHQEYDFLIFSWSRKLIIGVEMKRKISMKAFEQLERYHTLFEERLSDQLESGWIFFPAVCVENSSTHLIGVSPHFITIETNIVQWLGQILDRFPTYQYQLPLIHPLDQLKKILQIIVFTVHVSKKHQPQPITQSNWVQYIDQTIQTLSNKDNIVFYSANQLPVFVGDNSRYNKLVITGGFGSGKSFLMQEKALVLSQLPECKGRIMYVSRFKHSENGSLFYHSLKEQLEPHGILVKTTTNSDCQGDLLKSIKSKEINVLFLDEWEIDEEFISSLPSSVITVWIAPNAASQFNNFQERLQKERFKLLKLSINLRNSKEIVKASKELAEETHYRYPEGLKMPPENFPRGQPPVVVKDIEVALALALDTTHDGGILVAVGDGSFEDDIETISSYTVRGQVMRYQRGNDTFHENCDPYRFLKTRGAILVTDHFFITGFEYPTIIYIKKDAVPIQIFVEEHDCNLYLRCTTQLIIVDKCKQEASTEIQQLSKIFNKYVGTFDWCPLASVQKVVDVPKELVEEREIYKHAIEENWGNNNTELGVMSSITNEHPLGLFGFMLRCFKLLLPALEDNEDENARIIKKCYAPGGLEELYYRCFNNYATDPTVCTIFMERIVELLELVIAVCKYVGEIDD